MLLPDYIYRRIPLYWMAVGVLLLVFGLLATADLRFFSAYILLGLICVGRSLWLYQARRRVVRRAEVTVLTDTQKIERKLP